MEQNQMYEEEIDLKDLMYGVFKYWRSVLVVGIIVAIILGTYKGLPMIRSVNDSAAVASRTKAYEESLKNYEATLELFTREKENLEKDIENKEEYLNNALLMQLDPYNVTYSSLDYYIVAETYNFSILNYYVNYAKSSELFDEIINNCGLDTNIKYLKEVLTISADYDSNMLSIRLSYGDADISNEIIEQVKTSLSKKSEEIKKLVGEHIFTLVNESSMQTIDLNLETNRNNYETAIVNLHATLENKEAAIKELVQPVLAVTTYGIALKSTIKYAVIGGVLGVFLAAAYYVFAFLVSDKLRDAKRLRNRFHLKVLGDFQTGKEGKVFGFIDRWLAKCFGQTPNNLSKEEIIDMVATNLSLALATDEMKKQLLLTGSVSENEIKELYDKLISHSKLKSFDLQYGANINNTADTIVKAANSEAVVLIEKKNSSSLSEIEREIESVTDFGKKTIGVILL